MSVPRTPRTTSRNKSNNAEVDVNDPLAMIRKAELAALLDINVFTLDGWRRRKLFPKPIRLTSQIIAWRRSDVAKWLAQREVQPAPMRPHLRKRTGGAA